MTVQPRALCWRGTVRAQGLLFSLPLLGEAEARCRVLQHWRGGARLHRVPEGLVLLWADDRRLDAQRADGTPLVAHAGSWWALPVDEDERRALGAPPGAVVVARGGVLEIRRLRAGTEEDPARWLDLADWGWAAVAPLTRPPPPVQVAAATVVVDARASLLDDKARPPGLDALEAGLRAANAKATAPKGGAGAAEQGAWSRFAEGLSTFFGGEAKAKAAGPGVPAAPRERTAFERFLDGLRGDAARAIMSSPLGRALGRSQAEYLEKMMGMFERGDLDSALKHAIGLKGTASSGARPSLGAPGPRSGLDFSFGASGGGGGTLFAGDGLYDYLQQLYRRAFEQLARAGRIREAAYVLVELLGEVDEAVAFLEQHDRLKLAAQLAEGHRLPPGRVVRQWWLAGDVDRALAIARRTNAFATAVALLEVGHRDEAARLRLLWADTLAESGDLVAAADCLAATSTHRALRGAFLHRALAAGGVQAARAAPRLLELDPESFDQVHAVIAALTVEDDDEGAPARAALVSAMVEQPAPARSVGLRSLAFRAGLRDLAAERPAASVNDLTRMARTHLDVPLGTDLPAMRAPQTRPLLERSSPVEHTVAVTDRGALAAVAAASLQQGGMLLALGEAGLRQVRPDGRPTMTLTVPTEHLVVSEHGGLALTGVKRGRVWHLSRLLFGVGHKSLFAFEADRLATWTDGVRYVVAKGGEVSALDITQPVPKALWRVGDLGGRVLSIGAGPTGVSLVVDRGGREVPEVWRFSAPDFALRERVVASALTDRGILATVSGRAAIDRASTFAIMVETEAGPRLMRSSPRLGGLREVDLGDNVLAAEVVHVDASVAVTTVLRPGGALVHVWSDAVAPVFLLRLRGSRSVAARVDHGVLVVADDRGRLLTLQLQTGRLLRDLRLR
jgi:hypothetical protein